MIKLNQDKVGAALAAQLEQLTKLDDTNAGRWLDDSMFALEQADPDLHMLLQHLLSMATTEFEDDVMRGPVSAYLVLAFTAISKGHEPD